MKLKPPTALAVRGMLLANRLADEHQRGGPSRVLDVDQNAALRAADAYARAARAHFPSLVSMVERFRR